MAEVGLFPNIVACVEILQSYDGYSIWHTRYDESYNIHKHQNIYKLSILNQFLCITNVFGMPFAVSIYNHAWVI